MSQTVYLASSLWVKFLAPVQRASTKPMHYLDTTLISPVSKEEMEKGN